MKWLSQDFQALHFDTQAINETSSSWGLSRRTGHLTIIVAMLMYPIKVEFCQLAQSGCDIDLLGRRNF